MQNVSLSLELPSHVREASGNSALTSMALCTGSSRLSDAAWVLTFHGLLGNIRLHVYLYARRREDLRNWEEQQQQKMDEKQKKGYCDTTEVPTRYDESVFSTVNTILCICLLLCRWCLHQVPTL